MPDEAYAAVTFLSDSDKTNGKTGEALYMSATEGNNFFSFKEINNSNPVIESYADTRACAILTCSSRMTGTSTT